MYKKLLRLDKLVDEKIQTLYFKKALIHFKLFNRHVRIFNGKYCKLILQLYASHFGDLFCVHKNLWILKFVIVKIIWFCLILIKEFIIISADYCWKFILFFVIGYCRRRWLLHWNPVPMAVRWLWKIPENNNLERGID